MVGCLLNIRQLYLGFPHLISPLVPITPAQRRHSVSYPLAGHHSPTLWPAQSNLSRLRGAGPKAQASLVSAIPRPGVEVRPHPRDISSSDTREMPPCFFVFFFFLLPKFTFFFFCQEFQVETHSANVSHCAPLFHLQHSSCAAWHIRQPDPPPAPPLRSSPGQTLLPL